MSTQSAPLPALPLYRLLPRLSVASRTDVRRLAQDGAITVNGVVELDANRVVDPSRDEVRIGGVDVREIAALPPLHFVLHKPVGVVTTARDPESRRTVFDLLPPALRRARAVGRLDRDSSGILFFTTDGVLGHSVAAGRSVAKVYEVEVNGAPDDARFDAIRAGIRLDDGAPCEPAEIECIDRRERSTLVRVTLREGRYRQIRRSMQRIGLRVRALHRVAIGPLAIGDLAPAAHRMLIEDEVAALARVTR